GEAKDSRRRPKAHLMSVATEGRRRRAGVANRSASGGDPEGGGAPAQATRVRRSTRAAEKGGVRPGAGWRGRPRGAATDARGWGEGGRREGPVTERKRRDVAGGEGPVGGAAWWVGAGG